MKPQIDRGDSAGPCTCDMTIPQVLHAQPCGTCTVDDGSPNTIRLGYLPRV
jgi:hypothetical protein